MTSDAPRRDDTAKSTPASILILTRNRLGDLRECLESLPWPLIRERGVEVLILDDAGTDGTSEFVASAYPEIRLLRNETPRGVAAGRNQQCRHAAGQLLIWLDDDAVVTPEWLETLLQADDGQHVLGGRIVGYHDNRVQCGPARSTFVGKRLPCRIERANAGTGCNLAAPRAVFDALGGFDEELNFFEDSDFCIRAKKAGFGFRYMEQALVRHKGSDIKTGIKIQKQEFSSTYAMLKAYRGRPLVLAAFTAANGLWLVIRLLSWGAQGRFSDCDLLLDGWTAAYRRFFATQ